jgi:hypothetical protein
MADDDPNNENKRKNKEEIFDLSKKMFEIEKDIAKFSNKNTIDIQKQIDLKRVSLELDRDKADLENLFNEENKKRAATNRAPLSDAYLTAAKKLLDERAELEELSINRNATALKQQSGINYISGKIGDETKRIADNYLDIVKSTNRWKTAAMLLLNEGVNVFVGYEKSAEEFRKSTGLTISQSEEQRALAEQLNAEYQRFGVNIGDAYNAIKAIQDTFSGLRLETEQTADLALLLSANFGVAAENTAQTLIKFQGLGGVTEDVAVNVTKTALSMSRAAGVPFAKVMEDVAKASDDVLVTIGATPEKLFGAAIGARRLGVELNTIAATARRILDFNTSINDELNASALLGRSVNFQRARQLAFDNDIAGANEEILRVVKSVGNFNDMNLFQREALAKASGMELGTLTKMLAVERIRTSGTAEQKERLRLIDAQTKSLKLNNKEQDDAILNEREMQSVMTNLNNTFKQITLSIARFITPLVEFIAIVLKGLNFLADGFSLIEEQVGKLGDTSAKVFRGIIGALMLVSLVGFKTVISYIKAKIVAIKGLVISIANYIKSLMALKTAEKAAASGGAATAIGGTTGSIQRINPARLIAGAAAMVIAAFAVGVFGKAVQQFVDVEWSDVFKAIVGMGALVLAVIGLGKLMATGVGAVLLLAGAAAMVVVAGSVYTLGKAFGVLKEGISGLDPLHILKLAGSIAVLVGAMIGMGTVGALAGASSYLFTRRLSNLAKVINEMDTENLNKISTSISTIVTSFANVSSTKAGIDLIKSISDIKIDDAIIDKLSEIASLSDGLMNTAIAMERLSSAVSTLSNVNYEAINTNAIRKVAEAGTETTTTTGADSSAVVKAINDLRADLIGGKIAVYLDKAKVSKELATT